MSSILATRDGSVMERFAMLVDALSITGATDVTLRFKQKDLCALLGTQRTTLIASLDKLSDEEILDYDSNELHILDQQRLVDLIRK